MKKILIAIFVLTFIYGNGQTPDSAAIKHKKDSAAFCLSCGEQMPEFIYKDGFRGYLRDSIKYPAEELKKKIEGTVYIAFFIEADGSVTNVIEAKGIPGAPGLTIEAIRVISKMPNWKPMISYGIPKRVEMKMPVRYVIQPDLKPNKRKR